MQIIIQAARRACCCVLLAAVLGGCANVDTRDPRDPFEPFNRSSYRFNQAMDEALFNPIVGLYHGVTPDFLDQGITNFFSNINDVLVVINDILQFKMTQAMSDLLRLVINSSLGIGGLFDVSTDAGLPKHHEDFGQTLAVWGFGAGPYLVVPLLGPSTLRDAAGLGLENLVVTPISYIGDPARRAGLMSLNFIDYKADLLGTSDLIGEAALDEYEFTKSAYLNYRENLIHDRSSTPMEFEDFEDPEPDEPVTSPAVP